MKSYSLDLRQKIIETYENEPISQRRLAERFRVATSSVTRFLKQHRETGQLDPKPRPGRPKALNSDHLQVVQDLVSAQPDITLAELCEALHEQTKVKVSEPTMSRVLQRLNLSKKKSLHPSEKGSE